MQEPSTVALHEVAQPWVEEYVPELDVWVPKAALSEPRFRCVVECVCVCLCVCVCVCYSP